MSGSQRAARSRPEYDRDRLLPGECSGPAGIRPAIFRIRSLDRLRTFWTAAPGHGHRSLAGVGLLLHFSRKAPGVDRTGDPLRGRADAAFGDGPGPSAVRCRGHESARRRFLAGSSRRRARRPCPIVGSLYMASSGSQHAARSGLQLLSATTPRRQSRLGCSGSPAGALGTHLPLPFLRDRNDPVLSGLSGRVRLHILRLRLPRRTSLVSPRISLECATAR